MAVIVTGAAGFLGRAVLGHLNDTGIPTWAVDRRLVLGLDGPQLEGRRLDGPGLEGAELRRPDPSMVRVHTADLLDDDPELARILSRADAVIHLAGAPSVRATGPAVAAGRRRDNVEAVRRVLAAVPASVPLVVASSSSVYGGSAPGRPSAESDPLCPRGGYAHSKAAVEAMCAERIAVGARVTVVRPFTVAGEGQRTDMALSRWIAATRAGRPVQVYGSLRRRRDITDVRQVAVALVALARLGVPGPVNLGTGKSVSLGDMLGSVAAALGTEPAVQVCPATAEEVPGTLADTTRLRELLGWVPVTDLDALVRRQAGAGAAAAPLPAAAPA